MLYRKFATMGRCGGRVGHLFQNYQLSSYTNQHHQGSYWGTSTIFPVLGSIPKLTERVLSKLSVLFQLRTRMQKRISKITATVANGATIENTVKPQLTFWKPEFDSKWLVASPTCIAVRTITTYPRIAAKMPKLS